MILEWRSTGDPFREKEVDLVHVKSQESWKDWLCCRRVQIKARSGLAFRESEIQRCLGDVNKGDMWKNPNATLSLAEGRLVWSGLD